MSVIDTLIFDRVQADLNNDTDKAFYDHIDLNRVGEAQAYVRDRFAEIGYYASITPKTDWTSTAEPTNADLASYLQNLRVLRTILNIIPTTPAVPDDVRYMNIEEANNIERLLDLLDTRITRIKQLWFYSGELYSGEVTS